MAEQGRKDVFQGKTIVHEGFERVNSMKMIENYVNNEENENDISADGSERVDVTEVQDVIHSTEMAIEILSSDGSYAKGLVSDQETDSQMSSEGADHAVAEDLVNNEDLDIENLSSDGSYAKDLISDQETVSQMSSGDEMGMEDQTLAVPVDDGTKGYAYAQWERTKRCHLCRGANATKEYKKFCKLAKHRVEKH